MPLPFLIGGIAAAVGGATAAVGTVAAGAAAVVGGTAAAVGGAATAVGATAVAAGTAVGTAAVAAAPTIAAGTVVVGTAAVISNEIDERENKAYSRGVNAGAKGKDEIIQAHKLEVDAKNEEIKNLEQKNEEKNQYIDELSQLLEADFDEELDEEELDEEDVFSDELIEKLIPLLGDDFDENSSTADTEILSALLDLKCEGVAEAQYWLGEICYDGEIVSKDLEYAMDYYKMAAEQGYAKAQYKLGFCYLYHLADIWEGIKWLELAAENGVKEAQSEVAKIKDSNWRFEKIEYV